MRETVLDLGSTSHIAKKDLLEVNIVVVYKVCYLSKVSFLI